MHTSWCRRGLASILVAVVAAGCGGDDGEGGGGSGGSAQDAGLDVAPDEGVDAEPPDVVEASPDVEQDVIQDAGPDGPTGGVVLEEYEEVCARINGCLRIVGQGECMRRAYVYDLAGADEQRYYYALQSLSYGPGIPPGTVYFPDVLSCAEQAASCDDIYACLGAGQTCNPAGTMPYCDQDVLYNCADVGAVQGVLVEADCTGQGLSCLSSPNGAPSICADSFCDPETYTANCVGNVAYNCVGAGIVEKDCSLLFPGTTCGVAAEGGFEVAQCRGDGDSCDATFNPSCEGDDVSVCQDGFEYVRECPSGLPCGIDPGTNQASCGAMVTAGCTPETCDGAELTYCLDGEPRTLDCTEFGFGGCEQDDVFEQARCVP